MMNHTLIEPTDTKTIPAAKRAMPVSEPPLARNHNQAEQEDTLRKQRRADAETCEAEMRRAAARAIAEKPQFKDD